MTHDNGSNGSGQAAGGFVGAAWFIGWLFTWAFAKLVWWEIIVGIVIWPYFPGGGGPLAGKDALAASPSIVAPTSGLAALTGSGAARGAVSSRSVSSLVLRFSLWSAQVWGP